MTSLLVISDQAPFSGHGTSLTYSKLMSERLFTERFHFYTKLNNFEQKSLSNADGKSNIIKNNIFTLLLKKKPLIFDLANSLRIVYYIVKSHRTLKEQNFDFIYIPVSALNSMVAVMLIHYILPTSKIIIHFYDDPFRYIIRSSGIRAFIYKFLQKKVCHRANHIFSISDQMAHDLKKAYHCSSEVFSCPIPDTDAKFQIIEEQQPKLTINISGSISNKWLPEFTYLLHFFANQKKTAVTPIQFQYVGKKDDYQILLSYVPKNLHYQLTYSSQSNFELQTNKSQNCYLLMSGFEQWAIQSARTSFFTKIPYVCRYGLPVILYCPAEIYIASSAKQKNWAYCVNSVEELNQICQHLFVEGDTQRVGEAAYGFASNFRQSKVNARLAKALQIRIS